MVRAGFGPETDRARWPSVEHLPPYPHDTRHTWNYIFDAVVWLARIEAAALIVPHADTQAMSAYLVEIAKTTALGAHALPILDGSDWHG